MNLTVYNNNSRNKIKVKNTKVPIHFWGVNLHKVPRVGTLFYILAIALRHTESVVTRHHFISLHTIISLFYIIIIY